MQSNDYVHALILGVPVAPWHLRNSTRTILQNCGLATTTALGRSMVRHNLS